MNPLHKRFALFLLGCIGSRSSFAFLAKTVPMEYLPILGYLALVPATGFLYIFATGSRKTGFEVGGEKIWWNWLRPLHAIVYILFAYNAISKHEDAWHYLAADVLVGLAAFFVYHSSKGHFTLKNV